MSPARNFKVSILLAATCTSGGAQPSGITASFNKCQNSPAYQDKSPRIFPGNYRVIIEQFGAPEDQRKITGSLTIVCDNKHWSETKTYGYLNAPLELLDAPVIRNQDRPNPRSRDANNPGVLVVTWRGTTTLQIGTELNSKSIADERAKGYEIRYNGPGLQVEIYNATQSKFDGEWLHPGNLQSGKGWFYAYRLKR